ncbi:MAG: hypothetical protein WC832_02050 [Anaerolineales bacterium]
MSEQISALSYYPLILIGGPLTIQNLVKQYASLKGWERVLVISFAPLEDGNLASWSRKTGQAILEKSKPGDKIVIFLPSNLYEGWLKTLEAAGRLTEIPLYNLSIARQIATLHRWITALESKPRPFSRLTRLLKKLKVSSMFLKKHRRCRSPVPRQD